MIAAAAALSLLFAAAAPIDAGPGAHLAATRCAGCHAVGAQGASPNASAPTFREIRMRYNALSLERELARIAKQGHFEMRPLAISDSEAADIAAYIDTLEPAHR